MSKDPSLYGRTRLPSQHNPDGRCDNVNCTLKKSHHTFAQVEACKRAANTKA